MLVCALLFIRNFRLCLMNGRLICILFAIFCFPLRPKLCLVSTIKSLKMLMAGYLSGTWYPCEECGTNLLPWAWGGEYSFWSALWITRKRYEKWRKLQKRVGLVYRSPSDINQSTHVQGRRAGLVWCSIVTIGFWYNCKPKMSVVRHTFHSSRISKTCFARSK